jgi:hypothetical protein
MIWFGSRGLYSIIIKRIYVDFIGKGFLLIIKRCYGYFVYWSVEFLMRKVLSIMEGFYLGRFLFVIVGVIIIYVFKVIVIL